MRIVYDRRQSCRERLETVFLGATGPLAALESLRLHGATLHATRQRVHSPARERAASKLPTPVQRRNENAGHSAASSFDISEIN